MITTIILIALTIAIFIDVLLRVYQVIYPKYHLGKLRRELKSINILTTDPIFKKMIDDEYVENLKDVIKHGDEQVLRGNYSDNISKEELKILNEAYEILKSLK